MSKSVMLKSRYWMQSHRGDPVANQLAKRHYTVQNRDSNQFVPPGACVVLRTPDGKAVWVTSNPKAEYVKHAWAGAWVNSIFRNESDVLSSDLIRDAVACTRHFWEPPSLGMITFINTAMVRKKRDWGRCFRRAGFIPAMCPIHDRKAKATELPLSLAAELAEIAEFLRPLVCHSCGHSTIGGLFALQMLPEMMPEAIAPAGYQPSLFSMAAA